MLVSTSNFTGSDVMTPNITRGVNGSAIVISTMRLVQRPQLLHHRIAEELQRLESYTIVTFAAHQRVTSLRRIRDVESAALSRLRNHNDLGTPLISPA